eukprot:c6273_g1_i1 orf=462-713(+)
MGGFSTKQMNKQTKNLKSKKGLPLPQDVSHLGLLNVMKVEVPTSPWIGIISNRLLYIAHSLVLKLLLSKAKCIDTQFLNSAFP